MKIFYTIVVVILLSVVSCKSKSTIANITDKSEEQPEILLPIQKKYGKIIGVPPEQIKNIPLYEFIDSWMGTTYKMGGENKKGIDCSFFTQFLYHDVYNNLIERTAEKQFNSNSTDKFLGQEFLKQGDLLFFNKRGSQHNPITHVGVYLGNNYFVHSTSKRGNSGSNGVQISDFTDRYWQKMFVAAGRKLKGENK